MIFTSPRWPQSANSGEIPVEELSGSTKAQRNGIKEEDWKVWRIDKRPPITRNSASQYHYNGTLRQGVDEGHKYRFSFFKNESLCCSVIGSEGVISVA